MLYEKQFRWNVWMRQYDKMDFVMYNLSIRVYIYEVRAKYSLNTVIYSTHCAKSIPEVEKSAK